MNQSGTRRWWALAAISLAVMAAGLDATVLSLALPTLTSALHASESHLQWFVTSYTLALAVGMLPAGLLGDRFGRKRVMLASLVAFGAGSVACALAPSPEIFIAARTVLGLAGAGLTVMALSAITVLFDEKERPRAVGIWGASNFLALPIGPLLGGWMLAHFWWGWVFLVNVPVVLIGLIAILAWMAESRSGQNPGLDVVGLLTSGLGLAALMYGLIQAGERGWDAFAVGSIVLAASLLAVFVAWEARLGRLPGGKPLVDITLFRSRSFGLGVILTGLAVFGLFGSLFTLPQYFQGVMGTDSQGSGVRLLALIVGMVAGAVPADRIANGIGRRFTIAGGFLVLAVGMGWGSLMVVGSGDPMIAGWTFTAGVGAGLSLATAASAALGELSADRSGVGAALIQSVTKLGPAFGATILGSVLNATYRAQLQLGGLPASTASTVRKSVFAGLAVAQHLHSPTLLHSVRAAFVSGMDAGLAVSSGVALVGAIVAVTLLPAHVGAPVEGPVKSVENEHGVTA